MASLNDLELVTTSSGSQVPHFMTTINCKTHLQPQASAKTGCLKPTFGEEIVFHRILL